jgi:hypothetical protein
MFMASHGSRQRCGNRFPYSGLAPSSKPLIDGHPFTVLLRQIPPWRACANAPQNTIHNRAIIAGRSAFSASFGWQQVFQQLPFRFA